MEASTVKTKWLQCNISKTHIWEFFKHLEDNFMGFPVLKGYRYHKKYVKSSTEFDFPILNNTHVEECLKQAVTKIKIKRLETLQIQTFIRCKIRTDAQFSFFVQCSSSCTTAKLIHKANTN